MALPFLILGTVMDIANLCWLSSPPNLNNKIKPLLIISYFINSKRGFLY